MQKFLIILLSSLIFTSCGGVTEEVRESPKVAKTILAIGDSLTAGYGLPESESYPSQLEIELTKKWYNYHLQNAWISGDTSAWLLSRLDWVLEWPSPSLVILCIGANDAFQGKSTEDIEKNLREIIEKISSKNIPILFAGMSAPLNLGWGYGRKYEEIFPKLAKEYGLVFMPLFLSEVMLKSHLNQDDRIHPNKAGYAIIVENLIEILEDEKLIVK